MAFHIFGLERCYDLNGCAARLLDESLPPSADDDRRAMEVTRRDGTTTRVRVRPENIGRQASATLIANVLSSDDLALAVVKAVERGPKTTDLAVFARLAAVSSTFARALNSDLVWKPICLARWSSKWGYEQRKARGAPAGGWRARYREEEQDAMRQGITCHELSRLRFDFRFWLQHPPGLHGQDTIYDSALHRSISRRVRLVPSDDSEQSTGAQSAGRAPLSWQPENEEEEEEGSEPLAGSGRVLGHPNGDVPRMSWYLDGDGRGVQWGYPPQLWPKGEVRRLPSWGWEIRNPNVVLRAIDSGADCDADSAESGVEPRVQASGDGDDSLWADLIGSLTYAHVEGGGIGPGGRAIVRVPAGGIPGLRISPGLIY